MGRPAGPGRYLRVPMPPVTAPIAAHRWDGARLTLLDQTRLPREETWVEVDGALDAAEAIRRLVVRGAPNIGIAAAYAVALAVERGGGWERDVAVLRAARPTAVNLAWAVDRVVAAAQAGGAAAAREEAERIDHEEDLAGAAIGKAGADVLEAHGASRLLTHCNAGGLACGGDGSALAVAVELHRRHPGEVHVTACETRPLLQGARLTVWELARLGIPHALCTDGAAAGLLRRGELEGVVVGFDRVAANGDVCNKVGTYVHALAAQAAGRPFLACGPWSSIDLETPDGDAIEIEERDADEVRLAGGTLITVPGTPVRNPAFDVTPAALVTALVTERGVTTLG